MFSRFARLQAPRTVFARAYFSDECASKKYVHKVANETKNKMGNEFVTLRLALRESFHMMMEEMELKNNVTRTADIKRIDDLDDCIAEIHDQLNEIAAEIRNINRTLRSEKK